MFIGLSRELLKVFIHKFSSETLKEVTEEPGKRTSGVCKRSVSQHPPSRFCKSIKSGFHSWTDGNKFTVKALWMESCSWNQRENISLQHLFRVKLCSYTYIHIFSWAWPLPAHPNKVEEGEKIPRRFYIVSWSLRVTLITSADRWSLNGRLTHISLIWAGLSHVFEPNKAEEENIARSCDIVSGS